jgi:hypothetical protein
MRGVVPQNRRLVGFVLRVRSAAHMGLRMLIGKADFADRTRSQMGKAHRQKSAQCSSSLRKSRLSFN